MSDENTTTPEINYEMTFIRKFRWILFLFCFFVLLLLTKIPVAKTIDNAIYGSLNFGRCQIGISNYEFNFFPLPHLNFQNINIPSECLGARNNQSIGLKDLQVYFRGPSFSPLGPQFKVETAFRDNPLGFILASDFSFKTLKLLIKENDIDLGKFSDFIPQVSLNGVVKTDLLLELENFNLSELNINLQSNSLVLPAQNINGFALQEMPLKNLLLTANSENGKKLNVKKLVIGDEKSPIRSEFSGVINLNTRNIASSSLNLGGEIAFADSFINDPSMFLLKNYMQQFDKKDNFYQIQITGALSFPNISSNR
ncbi:MAG: hypothetical protein CME62_09825 [Halobacteriovoraceae bacterium]|nr:hypothetical protein [Halobacteriovoraceae bacterium]|tara:strand:+ start:11638 stop:12570 length:933 start_codon:yes stop_codon:yes gene_type:complete